MRYIILLCSVAFSCEPFGDCKLNAESYKEDECILVVEKIPGKTDARFYYKGFILKLM